MASVLGSCSTELLHMVAKHHAVFRLNTVAHGRMKVSGDAPTNSLKAACGVGAVTTRRLWELTSWTNRVRTRSCGTFAVSVISFIILDRMTLNWSMVKPSRSRNNPGRVRESST